MEKRKLIPLSMLLCSLCFSTACSQSSTDTNVIATINGKEITAENIYNNSLYNEKTASYVYEVLEKALVQSTIPVTNSMRTKVENEVHKWKNGIKENATLNSTNYEEDLAVALEEEGVSSEEELVEKKIYALQKEYAKTKFLNAKGDDYKKAYIDANYLYHISDIVLSISSSSTNTDLYNLTISSTEAKAIYDAFSELVGNEKYYNIASRYSSGATASSGGDLGIVTLNDTDISNELRYALIGYSSIVENKYSEFNLPTNDYSLALTNFYNKGMETIPYSYIKSLNDVYAVEDGVEKKNYESTKNYYYEDGGDEVSSSSKVYFRNILFNSLLNTKTPKFITVTAEDVEAGAHAIKMSVLTPNVDTQGYSDTTSEEYVLVNDDNNPYIVFKDAKGVHITSINKTPFDEDLYDYYSNEKGASGDPVRYIEFGSDMESRLDEVNSLSEKYLTRNYGGNTANEKLLSFEIFKYYLTQPNGNFKIEENVEKMINQYMNSAITLADTNVTEAFEGYYDTYSNLIWFRNQDYIVREVPILSCLTETNNGKYGCTYVYGEGFKDYEGSEG